MGRLSTTECTYLPTYLGSTQSMALAFSQITTMTWVTGSISKLPDWHW